GARRGGKRAESDQPAEESRGRGDRRGNEFTDWPVLGSSSHGSRGTPSRTTACRRRLTVSAALPLPGAPEAWRSASYLWKFPAFYLTAFQEEILYVYNT